MCSVIALRSSDAMMRWAAGTNMQPIMAWPMVGGCSTPRGPAGTTPSTNRTTRWHTLHECVRLRASPSLQRKLPLPTSALAGAQSMPVCHDRLQHLPRTLNGRHFDRRAPAQHRSTTTPVPACSLHPARHPRPTPRFSLHCITFLQLTRWPRNAGGVRSGGISAAPLSLPPRAFAAITHRVHSAIALLGPFVLARDRVDAPPRCTGGRAGR